MKTKQRGYTRKGREVQEGGNVSIPMAAPETLECLSGLLEGSSGSLVLLDRGDTGSS